MSLPSRPCAVLLLPGFSMLAASGVLDALQLANELQNEVAYQAHAVSLQGGPVAAANGSLLQTEPLDEQRAWHALFVVAGEGAPLLPAQLLAWRQLADAGCTLGGVDGGAALLAAAGLLDGQRATVDWPLADALMSAHPAVVWTRHVWEISGEAQALRLSCAGGTASLDLMLAWLSRLHGERLGQELTPLLGLERARAGGERQRVAVSERLGSGSPKLAEALALMEANLAEPLPTEEVARLVGVSRRQLERLFKQYLDALPSRYYVELRLQRARRLLQQSSQSILQIGLSCGFSSGPHFSHAYKSLFGNTPRDERSQRAAAWRELSAPKDSTP
ncbi:helix-turn-helix domain-containing protein [Paucibacter sediminis]|uniref:Helix-turn-helix domain-containing protein n=1 Tax=Paucibacter sediminis TaxID=3019553 RepID=A0AA95NCF3_9BURK|nr:helix-turn-helix domain-containing protein [Paucibacter sp. S2-9]WIT11620.1 helix-turn-helix domain-containing protein [Paucibacter sp. S2-9]